jgi:CDP-diacylglycerol--glycerol-3-phosphate 3-phosphatidyltransferase
MNLPNIITLSRIPLMFVIVGLMYCDWVGAATLAFFLFLAAASGDWLDGYIARKRGLITNFGKLMDALADKIMVMGLVIGFVGSPAHQISVPLALITLCREFVVTGMRLIAASKGVIVPADKGGKSKTITQLIALGFLLGAPMVGHDFSYFTNRDVTHFSAVVSEIGQVIFWLGTILAVWSGWRYLTQFKGVVFEPAD